MSIWTQKSASIQKRTSPPKFDDSAEKSEKSSVSNLSTKAETVVVVVTLGHLLEEGDKRLSSSCAVCACESLELFPRRRRRVPDLRCLLFLFISLQSAFVT